MVSDLRRRRMPVHFPSGLRRNAAAAVLITINYTVGSVATMDDIRRSQRDTEARITAGLQRSRSHRAQQHDLDRNHTCTPKADLISSTAASVSSKVFFV